MPVTGSLGPSRSRLDHKGRLAQPTLDERFALCREQLLAMCEARGERNGVRAMRRYYPEYLQPVPDALHWIRELNALPTLEGTLEALDRARELEAPVGLNVPEVAAAAAP